MQHTIRSNTMHFRIYPWSLFEVQPFDVLKRPEDHIPSGVADLSTAGPHYTDMDTREKAVYANGTYHFPTPEFQLTEKQLKHINRYFKLRTYPKANHNQIKYWDEEFKIYLEKIRHLPKIYSSLKQWVEENEGCVVECHLFYLNQCNMADRYIYYDANGDLIGYYLEYSRY